MPPLPKTAATVLLNGLIITCAQAQMPEKQQQPQQQAPEQQAPQGQQPQQQAPEQQVPQEQSPQQQEPQQQAPQEGTRREAPEDQAAGSPMPQRDGDSVEEGGLALSAYGNTDDTAEFQLGFGGRLDRGLGYFYIGHFETLSRASVSSGSAANGSIPENRYRSTRIGLYAEGHDASTGEGFGFGTFIYHNRSELVIDRYGLGATLDLAYVAAERVRLSGGVDLMPEYLSTDWDADAMLEYEWHADLRVLVHPKVDIGINWRAGRTNDRSLSTRQYEEVTAGFRLVF